MIKRHGEIIDCTTCSRFIGVSAAASHEQIQPFDGQWLPSFLQWSAVDGNDGSGQECAPILFIIGWTRYEADCWRCISLEDRKFH